MLSTAGLNGQALTTVNTPADLGWNSSATVSQEADLVNDQETTIIDPVPG